MNKNLIPGYLADWKDRCFQYGAPAQYETSTPRLLWADPDTGKEMRVASAGELMIITGTQKSRKTMLMNCMMMSNYTDEANYTFNFKMHLDGRPMVYYDTEQPRHRTSFNFRRFHKLCKKSEQLKGLYVLNVKSYTAVQIGEFITHTLEEIMQIEGTEPGFVGIDQIADLALGGDVNHAPSMDRIYSNICEWDEMMNHQALITPSIHTNRGGENTDGRLGKMFDKKCDSQFITSLDPKTHITKVRHKEARTARVPDFEFRQNFEGYPQLVSNGTFGV